MKETFAAIVLGLAFGLPLMELAKGCSATAETCINSGKCWLNANCVKCPPATP